MLQAESTCEVMAVPQEALRDLLRVLKGDAALILEAAEASHRSICEQLGKTAARDRKVAWEAEPSRGASAARSMGTGRGVTWKESANVAPESRIGKAASVLPSTTGMVSEAGGQFGSPEGIDKLLEKVEALGAVQERLCSRLIHRGMVSSLPLG